MIKSEPDPNLSPDLKRRKSSEGTIGFEGFLRNDHNLGGKDDSDTTVSVKQEDPDPENKLVKPTPISMRSSGSSTSSLARSPTPPNSGNAVSLSATTTCLPSAFSPASSESSSSPANVNSPLSSPTSTTTTLGVAGSTAGTPLLFQPFLPFHTTSPGGLGHAGQPMTRPLPFSIDNILKPTFGGRDPAPGSLVGSHAFPPFLGLPAGLAGVSLLQQQHQNLLASVHAAAAMAAASAAKENTFSTVPTHSSPSSPVGQATFSPIGSGSSPVPAGRHLIKPKISKVKQEPPPPASSPEKGTLPKDVIDAVKQKSNEPVDLSKNNNNNEDDEKAESGKSGDGDVPPGMVRGPNGQLWPAWVFCTRYSDRPSSGKNSLTIISSLKLILFQWTVSMFHPKLTANFCARNKKFKKFATGYHSKHLLFNRN